MTLGYVLCTYHRGHPVGSIPGTYKGRARNLLTFVTNLWFPLGDLISLHFLELDPCGKDQRYSLSNYSCYDLILFVFTFLK